MPLPAPNLDDRRFQELVDEAKRTLQRRCPEWTDHNVSDPGVTLIELFAWMTDQLTYRLNRVPERNYVKFLELIGVQLRPATAAHVDVTFWLSGSVDQVVEIPRGTRAATAVSELQEPLEFATIADFKIPPTRLISVKHTYADGSGPFDQSDILQGGEPFLCFQETPVVGDAALFGLDKAMASCAVELSLDARIEGVGVDPDDPPLIWEAYNGESWTPCDLDRDTTGGLNKAGGVVLHVPPDHKMASLGRQSAGWIRCRVLEAAEYQPQYTRSPLITTASARTMGGTVEAVNAVEISDEVVGLSEGVSGQRFEFIHKPVLGRETTMTVEVAGGSGWETWTEVENFAHAGADDQVFVLDEISGELVFGPAVRLEDGSVEQHGAIPPKGAPIRVPMYRTGGGSIGNVAARTVVKLRTAIPYVDRVTNRRPATRGVDVETMDNARQRGPIVLRTRNRAVTAEDYEHLAREVAPEIARVKCLEANTSGQPGAARLLIVPAVASHGQQLRFAELLPDEDVMGRIRDYLEERRAIGAQVTVEPASYQGVTIVARIRARPTANPARLTDDALAALHTYFHPTHGGPEGKGWPFGRPIHIGEVYAVLQGLDGTGFVEDARLFPADPIEGDRGEPADRIDLDVNTLVFSYEHRVRVDAG